MFLAILLASSLSLLRPAAESPITVATAALTFPEIARALSADGRTVVCGAGLTNRAAVVSLRGRSWEEARHAVSLALGVRIRPHPDSPRSWLMEADPEVVSRERAMRMALAKRLQEAVEREIAPFRATFDQPVHKLVERSMRAQVALEEREKSDPRHIDSLTRRLALDVEALSNVGDPFTQIAARLSRTYTTADYEAAIRGPQPFQPVDIHRIADVSAVCRLMMEAMAREEANRPRPPGPPEEGTGNPLFDEHAMVRLLERIAAGQITVFQRLYVSPTPFRVTVQQLYVVGGQAVFRHGISALIDEGDTRLERVIDRMGGEAKATLAADMGRTAYWLASKPANQSFTMPWTDEIACLSSLVEEWARQSGGDVVMELAPGSEGIGMLHSAETGGDADPPPSSIRATLVIAARAAPGFPWCFSDSGGILVVRNPMAFVDRTRSIPFGPLLRLERERNRVSANGPAESGPCTLTDLAGFHAACTPDESATLATCLSPYRGTDVQNLAATRFAEPLNRLAPQLQALAARRLNSTNTCDIPLTTFPIQVHHEITAALRAASLAQENGDDSCWLPDFPRLLRSGVVRLTKDSRTLEVSLLIPPPISRIEEPQTIATGTMKWEPKP
jgi:hypothetical protein